MHAKEILSHNPHLLNSSPAAALRGQYSYSSQ
jgi:hypothetical protein